jgi:galactose oxidase
MCLDVLGGVPAAAMPAIQSHCTFYPSQQWTVTPAGSAFEIVEQQSGLCLDVALGDPTPGDLIQEDPCAAGPGQLWTLPAQSGGFELVNTSSGLCANVGAASILDGAPLIQSPCSNAPNFLWTFSSGLYTSSTYGVLQAGNSGQCMNVYKGSNQVGGTIVQYPCAGATNEQWAFLPVSGGYYEVKSKSSALCLAGSNSGTGWAIVQAKCSPAPAAMDLFTLMPIGGAYQIVAQVNGQCVAVNGGGAVAATPLVLSTCGTAQAPIPSELWSLSATALPSAWTSVIPLPVDPIAVANLQDGTLLTWSANDPYAYWGDIGNSARGQTYTSVFDPVALTSTDILITSTGDDMFCPGTANLIDGRILVNGGSSSPKTSIYNFSTGGWVSDALMNLPRGYQGDTVLGNGSVLTFGGSWSGAKGGKNAEVWTNGAGWTELTAVPEDNVVGPDPQGIYRGDNHLWLFSAPNGNVFHAGPSAQMNWITTDAPGSITSAGPRADDAYSINGVAVLYDVGMIMKTGGAPAYQNANAEANTYLININNGAAVTKLAPMAYPRAFANGVILPNGQVVVVGGQTYAQPFSDGGSVLKPEIWDPFTQVFRVLNPMQTPRVYHSSAILLADGRVFVGGGGQCGAGCAQNHFNTEILTPPYLLNSDGSAAVRPTISSAPTTGAIGGALSVTTASPVVSFVLMRLSTDTHTVNNDQRRIPLQIASVLGSSYTLSVPGNTGIVLPGLYWLFALNAQGVPSVAATMLLN